MGESCSFCQTAIDKMDKSIKFTTPQDRLNTLIAMIEAWGQCMDCGDSRLTCYPLLKLASEMGEENVS